ncbi:MULTISPECIES: enoyl-ACP reductase [unclassified Wenzhouxiangella]|uniref:enoyl-ACP reductase FabI n=1 Tax=unclassified Wenzhouxiangella TaxID=2613841 RepID=UPI000E326F67|nr:MULTISPECIES: enoyl-ACP reductase [unclassified Wenzhouxiangella]RFF26287.1 enoyl-ACP reductase [Wenzhouxiangella sp. 15181]RFP67442.1 enoyl-ACP reductase [Wenzhouxiangella sp. 15190]
MGMLEGKKALIVGVASPRSIAWGIAEAMHREGAELAFTYQNEKLQSRVQKIADQTGSTLTMPLDVGSDEQIDAVFDTIEKEWGELDIIVHAVGYAPREQLEGEFADVIDRDGFRIAHDISSYSFAALARAGKHLMTGRNSAMLTLSYLGAVRAMPSYNVMGLAKASLEASVRYLAHGLGAEGIRVNGISAGPIKTLAASGVSNLRSMLEHVEEASPIRRNITKEDVGNAAAFLCSDLAAGISGEITYVDGGYNIVGMAGLD